ncbi:MAG: HelD family protein [Chitinispirillaceae bacterium]
MTDGVLHEEKRYLKQIIEKLNTTLKDTEGRIYESSRTLSDNKQYLWENIYELDGAEKASIRQSIAISGLSGESIVAKRDRLQKLLKSPYFGRINFLEKRSGEEKPVYIGVHPFSKEGGEENLIHDWRAPVSCMFYEYELGDASYDSPSGPITGRITLKRQYKINKGVLDFVLESSLNIQDDILQKELSSTSDEKMKNIVATIQRDQNKIIRNDSSSHLIIQGVAGSGKTSIALHRIAYLLYRFRDTISSQNVLIISPNRVFADYISDVLPELGEERILEIDFEKIAVHELGRKTKFQTFFEQVSELLDSPDSEYVKRIEYKATYEFLKKLRMFINHMDSHFFCPHDLKVGTATICADFISQRYRSHSRVPISKRFSLISRDIVQRAKMSGPQLPGAVSGGKITTALKAMFKTHNLLSLYREFYAWLGEPRMLQVRKGNVLEYADVFPLVYLNIAFKGTKSFDYVKHLVVDEMQDYTPVQYAVLSKLFTCKKTILGDARQSVNPYSSTTGDDIRQVFAGAQCMTLNKSYRSTFEIARFAQLISPNDEFVAIERHGEKPRVKKCENESLQLSEIRKMIEKHKESELSTLGIICKTQTQADSIHKKMHKEFADIHLLTPKSESFCDGILVTTAHMAKGLEFDEVIVPFACSQTYSTAVDKSMLYIACTRALHRLSLLYSGTPTGFIKAS